MHAPTSTPSTFTFWPQTPEPQSASSQQVRAHEPATLKPSSPITTCCTQVYPGSQKPSRSEQSAQTAFVFGAS
jgi:hypothetical protein